MNSVTSSPTTPAARRLSAQTFLLSEFLEQKARHFTIPPLRRKALVHGHCHHKSIMKDDSRRGVLTRLGLDFQAPAPGCCGMAGSFGFEEEKYSVSQAIGELELLPAVRAASPETLVIADGFSCREQIAQGTNRTLCISPKSCKWRFARETAATPTHRTPFLRHPP